MVGASEKVFVLSRAFRGFLRNWKSGIDQLQQLLYPKEPIGKGVTYVPLDTNGSPIGGFLSSISHVYS